MIAISSHRPHARSVEFRRNQMLAKRTWENLFTKIIYAGIPEAELQSQKTVFIQTEDFPTIQTLAKIAASQQESVIAILNADICIGQRFNTVKQMMQARLCASSRRFHFDPHNPNWDRAQTDERDRGRDIFIAQKRIWKRIAQEVPSYLRIGHQQWDAWVTDYFNEHCKPGFLDFTNMKCIFHPNHEDRQMPFAQKIVEKAA